MDESPNGAPVTDPTKETRIVKGVTQQNKLFNLSPQNMAEAMSVAKMIADSDFAPKDYRGKAGNCLIGMQYASELGVPWLQGLQGIAVINGKPSVYGDLGKALLQSKGFKIEERDMKDVEKQQEAWCRITRPDGQVTERTFSIAHAKTAQLWGKAGPWTTYPWRQMSWRAFWFAARDGASDVLKGMAGYEEMIDVVDTTIETENAPKEKAPEPVAAPVAQEPTPENPVVDAKPDAAVELIGPEERKNLVAMLTQHNVSSGEFTDYLCDHYGITETKTPTKFIPRNAYKEICDWISKRQGDLGV